ncbi:MAG: cytochrome P450 [Deltaproteobacteria bacterium]|nr:cytochrome P450 [Deltaproteobacteria bacterium]MBI3386360.1 cytochrome P450 [Deltaproteobacteria bacterium]
MPNQHNGKDTDRFEAAERVVNELFFTPEGRADPYPLYHQLRETAPVHRTKMGMWLLSRYDDCWAAMRDPRLGKDYAPQIEQRFGPDWRTHPSLTAGEHSMLNTTGPEHTRLRKLVSKSFTPRMIENLKPVIERTVTALLDPIAEAGGGNVLEAVGFPLPVTIIGVMLGVPETDRPRFRGLVRDLVAIFEMQPTAEQLAAADVAQVAIKEYFLGLIAEKRKQPGEDLLSALAGAGSDGDRLSDDELSTMASLLFGAGFETTTNLFGNGLLALLRHPDQLALLRTDDSLFANLPDEFLRYDGTAQLVNRVTEAAIDIGGITIPAGEQVFALLGAGNHDPAHYPHPDQLDVTRTEIEPVSFGGGVHFCLGAALARAEIGITFKNMLARFNSIELSGEPPHFQDRLTLRGLTSLHVACRSAAARRSVPVAAIPTETTAVRTATPASAERGLRPGGAEADLRWRAELRQRIESEPTRADSVPVRTGDRLAATVTLLSRNSLFQRCTRDELQHLAATAYPMSFEPGDMLCVEGGESPECYIIEEGHASVTIGRKGVATVGEHDVVGERGVLLDTVRSATVTAMSHMITYAISRERLRALVENDPAVREWMLEEMRRRYPNLAESSH